MKPLSEWTKYQKINAVALGVVAFVVLPLFTAILLSFEHPLKYSVTDLTFGMGYRVPFTLWGVFVIVFTVYSVLLIMKESGYPKGLRIFFYVYLALMEIAFVLTGTITNDAATVGETLARMHNIVAIITFVSHLVLVGLLTGASFVRSRLQGAVNFVYAFLFYTIMAFTYSRISVKDTFSFLQSATALCETATFCLVAFFLALHYVGNLLFPANPPKNLFRKK